jgi:mono/diheme cytochrome c family protein
MRKLPLALLAVALLLLALSFVVRQPAGAVTERPAAPTPALGRALFQAKGCTSCHRHDGLNIARVAFYATADLDLGTVMGAPDLTHYRPDPTFVRQWLRDPSAVRPETEMPNLRLSDEEIEALLAFLQTNDEK